MVSDYWIHYLAFFFVFLGVIGAVAGCDTDQSKTDYKCQYNATFQMMICENFYDRCYITTEGELSCVRKI